MASSTKWFLTGLDVSRYTNVYVLLSVALGIFVLIRPLVVSSVVSVDAPTVGKRSKYEPLFWVRTRFFREAWPILRDGYRRFGKSRFRFVRSDADIIVISNKYVDEIRSLPTDVLSPIQAHVDNLLGKYSTTDILLESDLHTRMLQTKLTPNIGTFVPAMKEELQLALKGEFPQCKAQQLIVPLIVERKRLQFAGDPSYRKPNDLLQWMMDAANEDEGQPHKLAHRQLLLTLAAIHTSTMAATHVMFDLCAQPEYFEPLREEVEAAIKEDGGWKKATLNKMQKLDSFLKESQRVTPPSLRM
ncbi:MAG: hypothetical protein Q9192_002593 [Flavoplaca navasiana]